MTTATVGTRRTGGGRRSTSTGWAGPGPASALGQGPERRECLHWGECLHWEVPGTSAAPATAVPATVYWSSPVLKILISLSCKID